MSIHKYSASLIYGGELVSKVFPTLPRDTNLLIIMHICEYQSNKQTIYSVICCDPSVTIANLVLGLQPTYRFVRQHCTCLSSILIVRCKICEGSICANSPI